MTSPPAAAKLSLNPLSWILPGTVMDRYIVSELIMPLIFGIGAFSSVGVAIGVLFDLVRRVTEAGLPLTVALQVFLLKLPYFIGLAFPMSMLLSGLMVYGRLSNDSELIALRSCGVSIYRLVAPAIALSLVLTVINFAFNEAIVPAANYQASQTLDRALKKGRPSFREKNIFYQEFREERQPDGDKEKILSRIFYARQFDGTQMKGLTILDFSRNGLNQIVASETAVWQQEQKTWDFFNGTIYVVAPDGSYRNIIRFKEQQLQIPRTPLDIAQTKRDDGEMNIAEIRDYLKLLSQTGNQREIRKLQLKIDQKLAFPFACLVFGLAGATLGVRPQRSGKRATSFGISLVIIVTYYLFISICEALYQFEILSAFLAGWLPTLIGTLAGGVLLFRLNR
jgi:lipopolysaccharide export system permease protein